jgi:hypothetical protein
MQPSSLTVSAMQARAAGSALSMVPGLIRISAMT